MGEDVLAIFTKCGALLDGHFKLTSGLHSNKYLQCALVLRDPMISSELGSRLFDKFKGARVPSPDFIVSPAIGGILIGQEVARAIGTLAIFTEREDGVMKLRRGFGNSNMLGKTFWVIEDIITTGQSTKEVADVVTSYGGTVTGIGCIIDRSGDKDVISKVFSDIKQSTTPDPFPAVQSLAKMDIPTWNPEFCPLCAEEVPIEKPGSRK